MEKCSTFAAAHVDTTEGVFQTRALQLVFKKDRETWHVQARGWMSEHLRHLLEAQNQVASLPEPMFSELAEHMNLLGARYTRYGVAEREVIEAQGRSAVALWEWLYRYLGCVDAAVPFPSAARRRL